VIEALTAPVDLLGESPIWDSGQQALYWVDIEGQALRRLRSGVERRWQLPAPLGSAALCGGGEAALVALSSGIWRLDLASSGLSLIVDPEPGQPDNRLNDGTCDPQGRFWVGSMDAQEREARGHYYCLDPEGRLIRDEAGFLVTNGLGFSRDGARMYSADSARRRIFVQDYELATGRPGPRMLFAEVPAGAGHPDGLTVDDEDHVWCCHWDGWRVTRYRPDGSVDKVVELPVPRPTCCVFGGPEGDQLFVTSARTRLDEEQLRAAPESGALFLISGLGVSGPPSPRYGGSP
jgi:sugar lactone lactonase YvrE